MQHPLEKYRAIASDTFISKIEESFYPPYEKGFLAGAPIGADRDNQQVYFEDEYDNNVKTIDFKSHFTSTYMKLENEVRGDIEEKYQASTDSKYQKNFIERIVRELRQIQTAVNDWKLDKKYQEYKGILLEKIPFFIKSLEDIYLRENQQISYSNPQIQWLEDTKLLTTLFYELLNGQKKVRKGTKNTKPFIKAKNADIERLLINNFLDSDGKPLKPETIKTYLNNSRPETRVQEGGRIELDF